MSQLLINTINLFKKCDIFGAHLSFTYRTKSQHKTIYRALLTIAILIIFIFKLYKAIYNIIVKDNLDFTVQEIPVADISYPFKNYRLSICNAYDIIRNTSHIFDITTIRARLGFL